MIMAHFDNLNSINVQGQKSELLSSSIPDFYTRLQVRGCGFDDNKKAGVCHMKLNRSRLKVFLRLLKLCDGNVRL